MLANDDLGNLGRLGNQMFQYTALRGLAQRHGYEYCLPPRAVVATRDINCVNSDITMFECFKIPEAPKHVTNFPKLMETKFGLCPKLWNQCPDNVSLYGYFQTEQYYKHIEKQIREAFTFVDEIREPTEEMFNETFGDEKVISIHIRRGDYVGDANHPTQDISYYEKALEEFDKDLPVIVFSDSIEWCKQQEFFQDDRFMFSEPDDKYGDGALVPYLDMCLMSLCDHAIIANSSMSWWGAWLIQNPNKKVVAPSMWFGSDYADKDTKDLYCEDWIVS